MIMELFWVTALGLTLVAMPGACPFATGALRTTSGLCHSVR